MNRIVATEEQPERRIYSGVPRDEKPVRGCLMLESCEGMALDDE